MRTVKHKFSYTIYRIFWVSFVILTVFIYTPISLAIPVDAVPFPTTSLSRSWVVDTADMFSSNTERKLNTLITELYKTTRSKIKVVTVADTSPSLTPKQFAIDLFKRWNIDNSGNNYGVLFLISKAERRVEIRTGSTTVKILLNQRVQDIIDKEITPQFKQGNYDEGALAGTKSIVLALQTNKFNQNDLSNTTYQVENNHFSEIHKPRSTVYEINNYWVNLIIWVLIILGMASIAFIIAKNDYSSNDSRKSKRSSYSDSSSDCGGFDFGSDSGSDSGGDGGGGGGDW